MKGCWYFFSCMKSISQNYKKTSKPRIQKKSNSRSIVIEIPNKKPNLRPGSQKEPQPQPQPEPQPRPQPIPQPEPHPEINPPQKNLQRLSLLSFISSFEEEKSFNETALEDLGLDLKCREPLLPMLHSVLSDMPLLDHSRHPIPECYSKIQLGSDNPAKKLSLFSPKTLLFIFYTYPHDPLQIQAATELTKRKWLFDEENEEWIDQNGDHWSVEKWMELDENQENQLVN